MRRMTALAGIALLALAGTAWAQAAEKGPETLDGYVPSDAILYVHYLGFTKAGAAFKDTEVLKLIREPEVQAFGAELSRFMDALMREKWGDDSVPQWADLRLLTDSEMAFALLDVRGRIPGMALIVRPGNRGDDLAKLVDKFLDKATQGMGAQVPEDQVEGVQCKSVGPFCVGWNCGDLIITSGKETLRRMARATKGLEGSLFKLDRYAAAAKRFGGAKELLTVWLDVERLREQTAELGRAERFEKVWEATGLKDVNYVRLGVAPDAPGVKETLYIHAPQGASGLFKLIPTAPVDEKAMLASVDEKAADVAVARLSAGAIYDVLVEFAGAMDDPDRVNAGVEDRNQALGFDLRKDLLGSLGDEITFRTLGPAPKSAAALAGGRAWAVGPAEMALLHYQFAASVSVKDQATASKALEKLVAFIHDKAGGRGGRAPVEVEKSEYKKHEFYAIRIPGAPLPLSPSYSFVDGKLILASTPEALKKAIDLSGAPPAKPLVDSAAWQAVRSHVAAKPSMLAWSETKESFRADYGSAAKPLADLLDMFKEDIPANELVKKLPRAETIALHLFGSISALSRDQEGYLVESYGFAGSTGDGVAQLGTTLGTLVPALANAQEAARRAKCMNNIRQIGLAMFQYAGDHDDKFPKSLGVLLHEGYLTTGKVFMCPSDKRTYKFPAHLDFRNTEVADLDKAIEPILSYVMVPGIDHAVDAEVVIVYDKDPHVGGGGRNCFFNDGHVKWYPEEEFQKLMKEQKDLLPKK